MNGTYEIRRTDGRSNQEVIVDYVRDRPPGQVFTFDELGAALSAGVDRRFDRQSIRGIVRLATMRLLREHRRTLSSVRGVGYRLAFARDHAGIAEGFTRGGQRKLKRAMVTMENANLEEMTVQERELHTAQCSINQSVYHTVRHLAGKASRTDELIARLTSRVEQLEGKQAG